MPSATHSLQSYITAAWITIWAAFLPQISQAQDQVSFSVGALLYCHQDIDILAITELYTIKSWDTFSKIASERGIAYEDFLLVWNYVNPEKNIDDTIRVWDRFLIMKAWDIYQKKLEILKKQLIAKNQFDAANTLFEAGNFAMLQEKYGFDIFPKAPVGIGIQAKMKNYLWEFENNPIAYGARTVLPMYQSLTICANLSRSTTRDAVDLDDPNLPQNIKELLLDQNIDAWHFHDAFLRAWYSSKFDSREYFWNLQSWVNPIRSDMRAAYGKQMLDMMRYLRDSGKADSKIPVFFLHTGAVPSIMSYKWGKNPSSHVFAYVGEGLQKPFRADYYSTYDNILPQYRKEFREGMSAEEYLIDLVQMRSRWWFTNQATYRPVIRENLLHYAEFVWFYVNGKKIDIQQEFENPSIFLKASDMIQLWGSVIYDGVHVKTAVDQDLQDNMNTSLFTFWEAMAVNGYFPAEILEPSEVFLQYGVQWKYAKYTEQIPVKDVSYLKEWEDVRFHMLQLIALNTFWEISYDRLTTQQKIEAETELQRQLQAHMLYGNLSIDGASWTQWSTRVNRAFYYYDTSGIETVFSHYIAERKKEFYDAISAFCSIWDTHYPKFIQILIFPWDTKADISRLIRHYLSARTSQYFDTFEQLDAFQKDALLMGLLGADIVAGKFQAGESYFVSYEILEKQLEALKNMSYLPEMSQLSEEDRALFDVFSGTQQLKELLAFIIVNESYINAGKFKNVWFEWLFGFNELSARFWRKGQKEFFRFLHEHNLIPLMNEILDWHKKIPEEWPQSFWDFQIRFENLYESELAFKLFPTKHDISDALALVLDPSSKFQILVEQVRKKHPQEVTNDLLLVRKLQTELQSLSPDPLKVAALLKDLFQTNDASNKHIVGKIVSMKLIEIKLRDHSDKIREQFARSGIKLDITAPEMRERYAKYQLLVNNMGEGKALNTLFENYLRRGFTYFQKKYPERWITLPPETRKSEWIAGEKAIYSDTFLKEDIPLYLAQINEIPELKVLSDDIKKLMKDGVNSWDMYSFFQDSEITQVYKTLGLDENILPTQDEFYARAIFGYANEKHLVTRMLEPERKLSDFRGVWFAVFLWLYLTLNSLAGIGNIWYKTVYVPTKILVKWSEKKLRKLILYLMKSGKKYKKQRQDGKEKNRKDNITDDQNFQEKTQTHWAEIYNITWWDTSEVPLVETWKYSIAAAE